MRRLEAENDGTGSACARVRQERVSISISPGKEGASLGMKEGMAVCEQGDATRCGAGKEIKGCESRERATSSVP